MAAEWYLDLKNAYVGLNSEKAAVAPNKGALYYETDTALWFIWTGSAWVAFSGFGATVAGSITASQPASATATLANVASSATSVTLQALNTGRKGLIIVNDSAQVLYVKFGSTASATSYTYKLAAGAQLELMGTPIYTGIVTGIWASADGAARMTELTA